jgi:hypothetical protein
MRRPQGVISFRSTALVCVSNSSVLTLTAKLQNFKHSIPSTDQEQENDSVLSVETPCSLVDSINGFRRTLLFPSSEEEEGA